jgi:hypothetical protein
MSTLDLLFDAKQFALAFDAIADDSRSNRPDATMWLEGGTTAGGAGFVWGHGNIHYQRAEHAFDIVGLSVPGLHSAGITATGSVLHLGKLSDFNGTSSDSAPIHGAALQRGSSDAHLRNERGVVIHLIVTDAGLRRSLSITDLRLRLRRK